MLQESWMGLLLCLCTCSSRQLQRGLGVVLHPVLQGSLHVGFGVQQQLQVETQVSMMAQRQVENKRR